VSSFALGIPNPHSVVERVLMVPLSFVSETRSNFRVCKGKKIAINSNFRVCKGKKLATTIVINSLRHSVSRLLIALHLMVLLLGVKPWPRIVSFLYEETCDMLIVRRQFVRDSCWEGTDAENFLTTLDQVLLKSWMRLLRSNADSVKQQAEMFFNPTRLCDSRRSNEDCSETALIPREVSIETRFAR
jgi:hypothetical protein